LSFSEHLTISFSPPGIRVKIVSIPGGRSDMPDAPSIITEFTPLSAAIGGAMIGLAATLLMLFTGRIAGISGILAGAFEMKGNERWWRIAFIAGLLIGGLLYDAFTGRGQVWVVDNWGVLIGGGLLVGIGTRMGSGCTSGHGVCGLARLSPRSIVATGIFMVVAVITVYVNRHLIGGLGS